MYLCPQPSRLEAAGILRVVSNPLRSSNSSSSRPYALALAAMFGWGLAASLVMVARSQVGGDQLNLLARGWLWAAEGNFIPFGNPLSTGGNAPGAITTVLVGLPFFVWRDHRAATVLVLLFHLAAYAILDRLVVRLLGPRARLPFALLYWLNPWRLYYSGFLWNPNYLFLFGAIHLWAIERQREAARFFPSFALAAGIGLALQIHPSALLLITSAGLLWLRRSFLLHWGGAIVGGLMAAIPLWPWLAALGQNPAISAADKGFLGRGLVYVFPLVRGLFYWFRFVSLALSDKAARFDFTATFGAAADRLLAPFAQGLLIVGSAGILVAILANARIARAARRRRWFARERWLAVFRRQANNLSHRGFLAEYALATFLGAAVIFAIAPTTVMSWQVLVIFHAAMVPPLLWLTAKLRTRTRERTRRRLLGACVLVSLMLGALAFGAPHYRCAGRKGIDLALSSDHAMLHELHIVDGPNGCPLPLDQPDGWWPDVLPKGRSSR